jgi:SOS response regulatory protein OraA/RecX
VRSKKEEEYREEEALLRQEIEAAISCLSMREIANQDLKELLSEPAELLEEFKEEDDFEHLITEIDKSNAFDEKRHARASIKETYY